MQSLAHRARYRTRGPLSRRSYRFVDSPCDLSAKPGLLAACLAPHRYLSGPAISPPVCIHRALRPNGSSPTGIGGGDFLSFPHHASWRTPVIGTVKRHVPGREAINQPLQGCLITTPTLPVQELACSTIQSFPDPEFATFFWRKCHISSSSRTTAFPLGLGFT
jgi:hypothetical protein